jgi:hypothetical protein
MKACDKIQDCYFNRGTISVFDCSSFAVARLKRLREVFGFKCDFAIMGLIVRPD